ncbi:uncharacterized protein LOC131999441 [Mustela nigripes]|uniref:uncharacterized protein LOC131999441 n=1 Tax=Mustela nigripes TaxID=77151 RepID=UPI002814EAEB|nr:uncharacterized protein LOC131999441 [Mustela nigripes]
MGGIVRSLCRFLRKTWKRKGSGRAEVLERRSYLEASGEESEDDLWFRGETGASRPDLNLSAPAVATAAAASRSSPAGPSHQIGTDPVAAPPVAPRSHSRRAAPLLVAPDPAAAAATTWGGGEGREEEWIRSGSRRRKEKEEEPLELEPPLPEPPFGTRGGSPSMPLSLSYCQYHRAAESMAHAQPNLLASSARLRRPLTGGFKREARPHWPASAFTPMPAGRNKFFMVTTNDRSPVAENLEDEKYFLTFINHVNILMYFPPVFFFPLILYVLFSSLVFPPQRFIMFSIQLRNKTMYHMYK